MNLNNNYNIPPPVGPSPVHTPPVCPPTGTEYGAPNYYFPTPPPPSLSINVPPPHFVTPDFRVPPPSVSSAQSYIMPPPTPPPSVPPPNYYDPNYSYTCAPPVVPPYYYPPPTSYPPSIPSYGSYTPSGSYPSSLSAYSNITTSIDYQSTPPPSMGFGAKPFINKEDYSSQLSHGKYQKGFSIEQNGSRSRRAASAKSAQLSERERLLVKWRSNFCETSDDIARKLAELENNEEKECWIRSSPADVYYSRKGQQIESTPKLEALCKLFEEELITRGEKVRSEQKPYKPPPRKRTHKLCRHKCKKKLISFSSKFNIFSVFFCS